MNLSDFRNLNPREVGSWPWFYKILVFVLVFLAVQVFAGVVFWQEQWDRVDKSQQEEDRLKQTFLERKKQALKIDLYEQQLKEIEQLFGALLRQLPNKSEMDALLTDINQAGLGRGLQFELFKPAAQEKVYDFYAELPINIKVIGSYHDFGAFASDVAALSRIVTLNDVAISGDKSGFVMEAVAKTFRYLDAEEMSKQRKAAKASASGGKK